MRAVARQALGHPRQRQLADIDDLPGMALDLLAVGKADHLRTLMVEADAVADLRSRLFHRSLQVDAPDRVLLAVAGFQRDEVAVRVFRIVLEDLCIRTSIRSGDIEWETGLVAAFHRLQRLPETETAGDKQVLSERWAAAHQQFHEAIVAACKSPSLMKIRAVLYAQTERYRRLSVPMRTTDRDVAGEHKAIFNAVIDRDADLAVTLMDKHLRLTTEIVIHSL